MNEIEQTASRLRKASEFISSQASALKDVADALRADVDALAARVQVIEGKSLVVAEDLIEATDKVEVQQVRQDDRLDSLENGS